MILVTGGTGLVGTQLLIDLVIAGKQVRAIKRKNSCLVFAERIFRLRHPEGQVLFDRIEWVDGDVQDYMSMEANMQGIEYVYHCAAVVSFDPKDKPGMMHINIDGTANVVNAALVHGIKKLCFVSSVAALGRSEENTMVDETCEWINSRENSAYAVSKYGAEREVWRGIAEGLNAVIVNPSIVLGPGDPARSSAKLFTKAMKGNIFYTKGINAFVDVRDVSRAMIMLMESEIINERFIIAAGNYSYQKILTQIAEGFGKPAPTVHAKHWMLELIWRLDKIRSLCTGGSPLITRETANTSCKCYFYNNEKISKHLGFEFIPIEISIKENCKIFENLSKPDQ